MQDGRDRIITVGDAATGMEAVFGTVGARLVALRRPDGRGGRIELVHGTSASGPGAGADPYAGAVCGRYANRIGGGRFPLDGRIVEIATNEGSNTLHGGPQGFDARPWSAETAVDGVRFRLTSPDGDQGFPGRAAITADYRFTGGTLSLDLTATTDAPTVMNLTHHAYWNLAGAGDALGHTLEIAAGSFTPVGPGLIPTGAIEPVAGTRFDFRSARRVAGSFDHNFCLDGERGVLRRACRLADPESGRAMEMWTTEAGLQVYTADHFGPHLVGADGPLRRNGGIALEPQTFPDAPNRPAFPDATLRPGRTYRHRIEWRFTGR